MLSLAASCNSASPRLLAGSSVPFYIYTHIQYIHKVQTYTVLYYCFVFERTYVRTTSTARCLMCVKSERSKDLQLSWATASSSAETFGAVASA